MQKSNNLLPQIDSKNLEVVLATDCGSTTTKAILFEKDDNGWHQTYRGEAPTTVEKPVADVTIGAKNALRELQELSGRKIIDESASSDQPPFIKRTKDNPKNGIDLYISTSSAGGGLQMVVAGVVGSMTAASAERAALGAGAIVMDTLALDDGREQYERVSKIRHIRPDIVLIAGGTNGGTIEHPLELAETVLQADPRPRFGETIKLPIIYAGNTVAAEEVRHILKSQFEVQVVDNLRPSLEKENLESARDTIHDLFLHHVMSHAPGYKKLLNYTPLPILPTPAAVGDMVKTAATKDSITILAVDIGGATTDVFSVFNSSDNSFEPVFNRTVSANLGMSYSVANVLLEAGVENIVRWLPFELSEEELRDQLRNKMIRPTSVPQTIEDLLIEHAVCREALRLAFKHHKRLAVGLRGTRKIRSIKDLFSSKNYSDLVDMKNLDLIIGSGGVLSHAPDRKSSALILIDAYEPIGITRLAVDSIFMMPHLGVLASIHSDAATEILHRDCLIDLGTVIAPIGSLKQNLPAFKFSSEISDTIVINGGELQRIELPLGQRTKAKIEPLSRYIDIGAGPGKTIETILNGGHAGIILDARGRPIEFNPEPLAQVKLNQKWFETMDLRVD